MPLNPTQQAMSLQTLQKKVEEQSADPIPHIELPIDEDKFYEEEPPPPPGIPNQNNMNSILISTIRTRRTNSK